MTDITTKYVGLKLKSPVIVGSAGITGTVERLKLAEKYGAGAVVMKSLFEVKVGRTSPSPRFKVLKHNMGTHKTFTLFSYEQGYEAGPEAYAKEVRRAKKELSIPVIASIDCLKLEKWIEYSKIVQSANPDAIELNVSCPHGSVTFFGGAVEETIFNAVREIRKVVKLPLIVKLSPQLTSPVAVVKELEKIGIDGVTIFNRITGLDIDIEKQKPILHGGYGGHGGPWAIQNSLRWISEIAPQVKIDINASGGVSCPEDVVKYLIAGATTVQTVSAIAMNGYQILEKFNKGLTGYMEKNHFKNIRQFRGIIKGRIKGINEVDRTHNHVAKINETCIAPCSDACPAGIDVQAYINLLEEGKYNEALHIIKNSNPFSSVCGYICEHPCEIKCMRNNADEPVAIYQLKQFISKHAKNIPVKKDKSKNKKIAVIGAGPAGLAAAYDLAVAGYKVDVFEKSSAAGGTLFNAIPRYRLPVSAIKKDIDYIKSSGVKIKTKVEFGKDITVESLKKNGYSAVFIATGFTRSKQLNIEGTELSGVIDGLQFLKEINSGKRPKISRDVVVIGGGNVAVDVARSAVRLGAKNVNLVCLESRKEMPAYEWEIKEAEEEGVKMYNSLGPSRILRKDMKASGVEFSRCRSVFDENKKFNPVLDDCVSVKMKADTVIIAIGQGIDSLNITRDIKIKIDPKTLSTAVKGVFVGGDIVNAKPSVINAVASGKQAAYSIIAYLKKGKPGLLKKNNNVVDKDILFSREIISAKREEMPVLSLNHRKRTFNPVELGFSEKSAKAESERCIGCGCGIGCGVCERVCIYFAVDRKNGKFVINPDKCDGCGLCAELCPHQNIKLVKK